jgi:phenylacetate-CoA ligase
MERRYYDDKETMPPQQREEYYNEKLRNVVSYAYENAPAMKNKLNEAGIDPSEISTVKDLEKVPITSKSMLHKLQRNDLPFGGFLGVTVDKLARVFVSTGPLYVPLPGEELIEAAAKAYYTWGIREGDRVVSVFPYHFAAAWHADLGLRRLGAMIIPLGPGSIDLQVQVLHELGVTGYMGSLPFLHSIMKRAEEQGYNPRRDFKLHTALAGGEMVHPSLKEDMDRDYGVRVFEGYAGGEMGMIAYNCIERQGLHISESLIVEIVDPKTGKQLGPGEVGEVVVTVLSKEYPVIRLGTGDLSSLMDEPCSCGRTSHRLSGILGRTEEVIKVRGVFLYPHQVREAVSSLPQILRSQLIISQCDHKDEVTFKLELGDQPVDEEKLVEELKNRFREVCRLGMNRAEFVSPGTIPDGCKQVSDERVWE